jgi:N-formylglutamate amidohydrolase
MILHIPHSSTKISDDFMVDDGVSLKKEFERMTDWYTDELFDFPEAKKLVFQYSRLYCDVERYRNDEDEEMAAKGMGVCYEKTSFGTKLRGVSQDEKDFIKLNYYDTHHKQFTSMVKDELEKDGNALIVDCHSFSNEVLPHEESLVRPDICVGTYEYHTPVALSTLVCAAFINAGFSVDTNEPFAGTIVPLDFLNKNKNVTSIMIEVNRKLYLDSNFQKNQNFYKIKTIITDVLKTMREYEKNSKKDLKDDNSRS